MTERRADRNRRTREQTRTRYDTPREDAAPTVAHRRLQLAANICRLPTAILPASTASQIWEIRYELLVALDA